MAWTAVILKLGSQDYPPIRSLLGVSSTEVPDETIEQLPFLPAAEAIVKVGITDYASLTGDNEQLLKAGTQALTAALLCQQVEADQEGRFQIGEFQEWGSEVDWRVKARDLLETAKRSLGAISTRTYTRRTLMAVAGPTRSGTAVPEYLEQWIERIVPRFVDWVEEGEEDDDWVAP